MLDVMLPGMNGFDVLRRIRGDSNAPILMLTARGDDVDRIVGLEMGADDYLPKPFNPRELVARIRAILRRAKQVAEQTTTVGPIQPIVVGDVELDPRTRIVKRGGERIELTAVEFNLLEILMREAGSVVSRESNFEAQNRNCSVQIVCSETLQIWGIKDLLRSAIENVIRNSLSYTKPDSNIEISLLREHRGSISFGIVRVRDHGEGVPEDALEHLFRPFFRVGDARERKSGGTGLGLTITERAVRLHGGFVFASNAKDGGLIVELQFPLVRG